MDNLVVILFFALGIVILLLVFPVITYLYQRAHILNRYVWLDLLDRQEWKTSLWLRKEMRRRVGTEGPAVLYSDLEKLEDEGLIESREYDVDDPNSLLYEYRLTTAGLKQKFKYRRSKAVRTLPRTV